MLALMQLIFHYGFLKQQPIFIALADWQFALLVFATVCIAASGYLINNIYDVDTDLENKPQDVVVGNGISEAAAYNYYFALSVVGVGIGYYLCNFINHPAFFGAFAIITLTLYMYASSFKRTLLLGNVIVALLLSCSVLIVGVFDLLPAITADNQKFLGIVFQILLDYAIFTFIINFIREIVKDLEDVNGDYNQGMSTLPIVLGVKRTAKVVFGLSLIPVVLLCWYIYTYVFGPTDKHLIYATLYGLVFLVAPSIYFSIKAWSASKQNDFHHLSTVLKWIMLFGIFSILVITINMKFNVTG